MTTTLSEICTTAAEKVFGAGPNIRSIAQGYVESAISRLGNNYHIDIEQIPESTLRIMAESASWFVWDNKLHEKPSDPTIGAVRDSIAADLRTKFPLLDRYQVVR